jgi:hypothetical protein
MINITDFIANLQIKKINACEKAQGWTIKPIRVTAKFVDVIKKELAQSYLSITTFEELYRVAGMDAVFDYLRANTFPKRSKTLKGNFGEVLCQTYVKAGTDFEVPFPKLRFRFAREPSPHGEDVVGFLFRDDGPDALLLVEAKLRTKNVTGAIKEAHNTIEWSVNGQSECFILHQILSILEQQGDADKCHRVNTMLTDYHGDKFEKVGAIFIVTPEEHWKDSHFVDHIENNHVEPLWCWAFVVKDLKDLIRRTH